MIHFLGTWVRFVLPRGEGYTRFRFGFYKQKNLALLVIVAVLPALLSATMEQWRHSIVVARQIGLFLTHSMVEVQKRITSSIQQTLSTHGAGTPCLNCEASTATTCADYPPAAVFISLLVS